MSNLFEELPADLSQEAIEILASGQQVTIERIVSNGQSSPNGFWYDQNQHEWVILLKGEARIEFIDNHQTVCMKPGDYLNIEAHRKHRVAFTSNHETTVWLAIHYSPS